jgi:hypothetical protein
MPNQAHKFRMIWGRQPKLKIFTRSHRIAAPSLPCSSTSSATSPSIHQTITDSPNHQSVVPRTSCLPVSASPSSTASPPPLSPPRRLSCHPPPHRNPLTWRCCSAYARSCTSTRTRPMTPSTVVSLHYHSHYKKFDILWHFLIIIKRSFFVTKDLLWRSDDENKNVIEDGSLNTFYDILIKKHHKQ